MTDYDPGPGCVVRPTKEVDILQAEIERLQVENNRLGFARRNS